LLPAYVVLFDGLSAGRCAHFQDSLNDLFDRGRGLQQNGMVQNKNAIISFIGYPKITNSVKTPPAVNAMQTAKAGIERDAFIPHCLCERIA